MLICDFLLYLKGIPIITIIADTTKMQLRAR
jgi:hypothetical protein